MAFGFSYEEEDTKLDFFVLSLRDIWGRCRVLFSMFSSYVFYNFVYILLSVLLNEPINCKNKY